MMFAIGPAGIETVGPAGVTFPGEVPRWGRMRFRPRDTDFNTVQFEDGQCVSFAQCDITDVHEYPPGPMYTLNPRGTTVVRESIAALTARLNKLKGGRA